MNPVLSAVIVAWVAFQASLLIVSGLMNVEVVKSRKFGSGSVFLGMLLVLLLFVWVLT